MFIVSSDYTIGKKLKLKAIIQKKKNLAFICRVTLIVPRDKHGRAIGYEFTLLRQWYKKCDPLWLL